MSQAPLPSLFYRLSIEGSSVLNAYLFCFYMGRFYAKSLFLNVSRF